MDNELWGQFENLKAKQAAAEGVFLHLSAKLLMSAMGQDEALSLVDRMRAGLKASGFMVDVAMNDDRLDRLERMKLVAEEHVAGMLDEIERRLRPDGEEETTARPGNP
jgi:hypothetical protein